VAVTGFTTRMIWPDLDAAKSDRRASVSSLQGVRIPEAGTEAAVFVFFSNRLGCMGSILVSVAATVVLLIILSIVNSH